MDHSSQLRAFDEINPFFLNWIKFTFDQVKLFGHYKTETDNFQKQNTKLNVRFCIFWKYIQHKHVSWGASTMSLSRQVHILN